MVPRSYALPAPGYLQFRRVLLASACFAGSAPIYADNEILFPPHAIPRLARARGEHWRELVERVTSLPPDDPDCLAFSLMMIRLDGCLSCETDSFRAMRGCTACALQTLHRFKGSDQDLLQRYRKAAHDVRAYLAAHPQPEAIEVFQAAQAA